MLSSSFTPWASLLGGVLIGAATVVLLLSNGRLAGISGICAGVLERRSGMSWRVAFIVGLAFSGAVAPNLGSTVASTEPSIIRLFVAGLLVGVGARIGGGCTSGHGVCGIGRLSKRSLVATLVFMSAAMLTVAIERGVS